jgi:hypothetical protein
MKSRTLIALAGLAVGVLAQTPPNNNCTGPIGVSVGVNPASPLGASGNVYTNVNATTSTSFPAETACGDGSPFTLDVFFTYTAAASGSTTVQTCTPPGFAPGTLLDSMVAVYAASACPSGSPSLACGDESCNGSLSSAVFTAVVGTSYLIRVGSWNGASTGTFYLTILVPVTNNECSSAVPVDLGVNPSAPAGLTGSTFSNVGATTSSGFPPESVCAGGGALTEDVFFTYTSAVDGPTTVATCTPPGFASGSLGDSMIAVYESSACSAGAPSIACDDQGCGNLSQTTFTATAGATYLVRVGSWDGDGVGSFYLTISHPTPSNDEPTGALVLSDGVNPSPPAGSTTLYTNVGASSSASYLGATVMSRDVFFSYTPTETGEVSISLCPSGGSPVMFFDAVMRVFDGMGELAFDDDTCAGLPTLSMRLTAGVVYVVQVGGFDDTSLGTFQVFVRPEFSLTIDSPIGPGSLRILNHHGVPGSLYYTALTLTPGGYPNGWFFGVAPSLIEIYTQLAAGPPFVGVLNGSGVSSFVLGAGLPPLTLYGVTVAFGPGNVLAGVTAPAAHTL